MKRFPGKDGRTQLWFEPAEIEEIMLAELGKAGLVPSPEDPSVDIEAFVEQHLKVQFDQYADLPADVLGETEFRVGATPRISLNRDLTGAAVDEGDSPALRGRWRATVAHKGAHVLLHARLFDLNPDQILLFADSDPSAGGERLQRCLKRNASFSNTRGGDWREIQANMGMAALLMPKPLFTTVCIAEAPKFCAGRVVEGAADTECLVARLAGLFKVSRQAAGIRLKTPGLVSGPSGSDLL